MSVSTGILKTSLYDLAWNPSDPLLLTTELLTPRQKFVNLKYASKLAPSGNSACPARARIPHPRTPPPPHTHTHTPEHTLAHQNTHTHRHQHTHTHTHTHARTRAQSWRSFRSVRHSVYFPLPPLISKCSTFSVFSSSSASLQCTTDLAGARAVEVPKQVECELCRFSRLFLTFFYMDGSDWLEKLEHVPCQCRILLCVACVICRACQSSGT